MASVSGYGYGTPAPAAATKPAGTAAADSAAQPPATPAANTSTSTGAALPQLAGGSQDSMMQIMKLMLQMFTLLLGAMAKNQAMDRSTAPAGSPASNPISPIAAQAIKLPSQAEGAQAAKNSNVESNPNDRNALQQSLDAIAADPEGRALLAEAEKRGVTIEVGDPSQGRAAPGTVVNGVTISQGNKSKVIVRDPANIKTIVHELVHATSTQDGNSQHEEGIADVIGKRVESHVTGKGLENQNTTYNNKLALYPELKRSNGIEGSLAAIGLKAFA